jgi:hypothetical protein
MKSDRFDAFTRTLSTAGSSRGQALRFLGSTRFEGALWTVARNLG